MDLVTIKDLFEIYLSPIQSDIKDLKEGQLQLIEIAKTQAKHSEAIENIKEDVVNCVERVENIKESKNKKIWDVVRLGIAGFIGAIFGKYV